MRIPGFLEIGLIVLVLFLFFGASRLPKLAKSIASSVKEFRSARLSAQQDDNESVETETNKDAETADAEA